MTDDATACGIAYRARPDDGEWTASFDGCRCVLPSGHDGSHTATRSGGAKHHWTPRVVRMRHPIAPDVDVATMTLVPGARVTVGDQVVGTVVGIDREKREVISDIDVDASSAAVEQWPAITGWVT